MTPLQRTAVALLCALLGLHGEAGARAPQATVRATPADLVAGYLEALDRFRAGDGAAGAQLEVRAQRLAESLGRPDPVSVASYYLSLTPSQRRTGWRLEARFDGLRDRVVEAEAAGSGELDAATAPRLTGELTRLLDEAELAADVTAAARTAALLARIQVRALERMSPAEPRREALAGEAAELADRAAAWFGLAGLRTPLLEARWVRARVALVRGERQEAEAAFRELADLAEAVDRPSWRERGLLGIVGVARECGAPFAATAALEELATFRDPARCWALARELAAQRLSEDRPDRALEWLEACPPSHLDQEIDLAEAVAEWRTLQAAALLRSGATERAAEALADVRRAQGASGGQVLRLTEAALLLDRGEPEAALQRLGPEEGHRRSEVDDAEALVLRGRALLALGLTAEAIGPLQEAFDLARARDAARWGRAKGELRDGSAVGEWLGLSTVEVLARARASAGQARLAAATIESAHAGCSIPVADERLSALAATQDLGLLTWVVGADRTLVVHVRPDGTAEAEEIPRGRRELARARDRVRDAVLLTREVEHAAADDLLAEVASALLPGSFGRALARWERGPRSGAAPSLAVLPHGVLEGIPFELLPAPGSARVLGFDTALVVVDRLRDEAELPPRVDGREARWIALGAPAGSSAAALPWAERELRDLARLDPRLDAVTGRAFDAAHLLAALAGERPVHLATHVLRQGSASSIAPLALLASEDERVSADDLAAAAPRLPLLVLATCDSASGRSVDGLSTRGLAQAALDAGTRAAVVTGWSLADRRGRAASITFHAALRGGATPAEALRRTRGALVAAGAAPADSGALRLLGYP